MRFPGQYADDEVKLNYNYFRDYDSSVGRYIEVDPIGLDGGLNVFGYAEQNPVLNYDPDGLQIVTPRLLPLPLLPNVPAPRLPRPYLIDVYDVLYNVANPPKDGAKADAGSVAVCDPGGKDPCKGFRDELKNHQQKLRNYVNDPLGNDNDSRLSTAYLLNDSKRAESIYNGRVKNLKRQIANFRRQLEDCEKNHGIK